MEFVPYVFTDSVVCLSDPREVREIKKLGGYWGEAGRKVFNHRLDVLLLLLPLGGDRWNYALKYPFEESRISNWEQLIAEGRCLVITAIIAETNRLELGNQASSEAIPDRQLKILLSKCYRRPVNVRVNQYVGEPFTPQQRSQLAELFLNFNVENIQLNYAPEFHQFLVNAFTSQYLSRVSVHGEIPESLHPHILDWVTRGEFKQLRLEGAPDLKFHFCVFENLIQRVQRKERLEVFNTLFSVYFSETAYEEIQAYLRAAPGWSNSKDGEYSREFSAHDLNVKLMVLLFESGKCTVHLSQSHCDCSV